jgi:uncharacterized protein YbjT (DUF2867 family)
VVTGDLNQPDSLSIGLCGARGVFLLSGYAEMPGLLSKIADAGVDRVVLLSSGAVVDGDVANAIVRYNMGSEEAVRDSGVPWTILRPSGFHGNALQMGAPAARRRHCAAPNLGVSHTQITLTTSRNPGPLHMCRTPMAP